MSQLLLRLVPWTLSFCKGDQGTRGPKLLHFYWERKRATPLNNYYNSHVIMWKSGSYNKLTLLICWIVDLILQLCQSNTSEQWGGVCRFAVQWRLRRRLFCRDKTLLKLLGSDVCKYTCAKLYRASSYAGKSKCLPATSWIFNIVNHELNVTEALSFENFLLNTFINTLLEQFEGLLDCKGCSEINLTPLTRRSILER